MTILDRNFYSGSALTGLKFAHIGYDNIIPDSSIVGSSSQAGFDVTALQNPFTYEFWKPTSLPATVTVDALTSFTADYVGLGSVQLKDCNVTLESSVDGVTYVEAVSADILTDNDIMLLFASTSARYWRFTITALTGTPTVSLSVLNVGESMPMQRMIYGGHTPATLNRRTETRPNMSEGGQWLGRTIIRKGNSEDFSFNNLTSLFVRDTLDPFIEFARVNPFFVLWRPESFGDEAIFGWVNDDIAPVNTGTKDFMSVEFTVMGSGGNG